LREIFKPVTQVIRLEAPTKQNQEIQSLANQTLKDEIGKK
jgi:hypothetical protein